LYKSAAILFFVCFFLYILFTRTPDYFDAETTPGYVVLTDSLDYTSKSVEYRVGHETFVVPIQSWGTSQVSKGEKVEVIYNPTIPSEGSLYTFFAYWLHLPELLTCVFIFIALFAGAVFITGENQPEEPVTEGYAKKRKYKD
jgi:hypothetical protein